MCDTLLDLGYLFIGLSACEKRHDVSTSVMEMERAGLFFLLLFMKTHHDTS